MISIAPCWVRVPLFLELLTIFIMAEAASLLRFPNGLVLRLIFGVAYADSIGEGFAVLRNIGDTSSFQVTLGGV